MFKQLSFAGRTIIQTVLCLLAIIYILPLFNVVRGSLSNGGLNNYFELFNMGLPIWRMIFNSLAISFLQVIVIVMVSSMASFSFSKLEFKLKNVLYTIIMLTMALSMLCLIIPLFQTIKFLGLSNSYFAMVLPGATFWLPVAILIQKNYYDSLGKELMEATLMDGGSYWTCFWRVYFPLGKPATINVIVFAFMNSWNDYLNPLLFARDQSMYTLPMAVVSLTTTIKGSRNEVVFACLVIMAIPSLILYLFLQDQLGEGMTAGSVKG